MTKSAKQLREEGAEARRCEVNHSPYEQNSLDEYNWSCGWWTEHGRIEQRKKGDIFSFIAGFASAIVIFVMIGFFFLVIYGKL